MHYKINYKLRKIYTSIFAPFYNLRVRKLDFIQNSEHLVLYNNIIRSQTEQAPEFSAQIFF